MKSLIEEINFYHLHSTYSSLRKNVFKRRLDEFLRYLAKETSAPVEEVHLEKIYERVNILGQTLFFLRLDVSLVDQFFLDHLHKSYSWLHESRHALQSFFLYLNRKYDFPILTDEMNFIINAHKQAPQKKDKYVPTRHDLLRFLQSLIRKSSNLERDLLFFILLMTTGSRSSEILNTKVNEIDLLNETIFRKQTKNKSSKFIVLRSGFGKILKRYIEKFGLDEDDYLINNNRQKMDAKEFQDMFVFYFKDTNIPFVTLHKIRHSFATIMAESGAAILVIQQLLGHIKIHSTKTYIDPNYIRNNGMELQVNKNVYKHIKKVKPTI
jgi:integrase